MANVSAAESAIFKDVFFACIPSPGFEGSDIQLRQIVKLLERHGAVHCLLDSHERLRHVTHLISTTADFPAYHDAVDSFIHVVTPVWVERSIEKSKAANPRAYSPDPKYFLSNVVLSIAEDIPDGDRQAIIGGVIAVGGQYSATLTKLTTHVVALSTDNPFCKIILERKLSTIMVLPHWFDHCMKLGKKLDTTPYVLPDPPILNTDTIYKAQLTDNEAIDGASTLNYLPPPDVVPSKSRQVLSVFRNKTIVLSGDLEINAHMRGTLERMIKENKGVIGHKVSDADMLICRWRSGKSFTQAVREGVDVGTLTWLWWMINNNAWTSPTKRLLHYPRPKHGLPFMKGMLVSVSNYTGEARVYLESLVEAAGAQFTKTLTQSNTHLITAHTRSEKVDAAREWGINIVNHLWLEESYAKCQAQPLSHPRYTTFPSKTNLGEVIGQTEIDRIAIKTHYLPDYEDLKDSDSRQQELSHVRQNIATSETKAARKTATSTPRKDAEKENEAYGGRASKNRALDKLHSMASDIALFEKESKRVGGVIYGGRRVTDEDRIPLRPIANQKRVKTLDEQLEDSTVETPRKKAKKDKSDLDVDLPTRDTPLRVLLTAIPEKERTTKVNKLRQFSHIRILDHVPKSAGINLDVLVAPRVMRTEKFVAAIAQAPAVVNTDWLDQVIKSGGRELSTDEFHLDDWVTKSNGDASIQRALTNAKQMRDEGGLLNNWTIFVDDNLNSGTRYEAYEDIIARNGGKCILWRGRVTKPPKKKLRRAAAIEGADPADAGHIGLDSSKQHIFLLCDPDHSELWRDFQSMAVEGEYQAAFIDPEWLMRIALEQDLSVWEPEWQYHWERLERVTPPVSP